jgi:Kef-type K+ transport system membrane component KefB
MTDTTTLFIVGLFLLVALSVLVGELMNQLGQAALVGQLMVGVVLGPTILGGALGLTTVSSEFTGLETLATFFILLMAGLVVSPEEIWATGRSALILGLAIFFIPFAGAIPIVLLVFPQYPTSEIMFIALTISITALPVLGVMLREFGLTRSRFGVLLMNAAVINELSAVTVFAVLLRIYTGGSSGVVATGIAVGTVVLFLATILGIHFALRAMRENRVWDRVTRAFRRVWRSREAGFALVVVLGLAAALYSQYLGLTFIVGAFYAGMLITPESAGKREHRTISQLFDAVTWGFFIPIFFALVGFSTDFRTIPATWPYLVAIAILIVYAVFSKVIVGSVIARALGWSKNGSLAAGYLVSSRGAVELAMALILYADGIFGVEVFTIVAGIGLATTIISPIGARPFVRKVAVERPETSEFGGSVQPYVMPETDQGPMI